MQDLFEYRKNVILHYQQTSGAYSACPNMPDYQFCWFCDGSFIAHAMLLCGEVCSVTAYHVWAARKTPSYEAGARRAMNAFQSGTTPDSHDVLRARHHLYGRKGT